MIEPILQYAVITVQLDSDDTALVLNGALEQIRNAFSFCFVRIISQSSLSNPDRIVYTVAIMPELYRAQK